MDIIEDKEKEDNIYLQKGKKMKYKMKKMNPNV